MSKDSEEKSLIKLSAQEWTHDQRVAVARVAAQALTRTAPTVGEAWSDQLWNNILNYLKVTEKELESRVMHLHDAVQLLSLERDVRIEVLVDLVALALEVNNGKKNHVMVYDARSRRFLLELQSCLDLSKGDLSAVERSIAQQIYYALLENQAEGGGKKSMQQTMDSSAKKAMESNNKKKDTLKWIATGAGVIGGGALIGMMIERKR